MGFVLEIGVQVRKSVIPLLRTCFRSLFRHPFLVAFLLFMTFLYRFFPFAFSLLVTASPVLVCSVVLLGTLLIFGQTNLPKTEREKKITHHFGESVTLERKRTLSIDKFLGKSVDEVSCSRYSSDSECSIGYVPLIDETSHYPESKMREFHSNDLVNQRVIRNEKLGIDGMTRDFREAIEKSASLKDGGDHSESSQGGGGGDDEASDSGSTESWLPDAPIEDILPILDDLHPLLDIDVPLPAPMTTDDSVGSDRSNDGSNQSDDDDTEIRGRGVQMSGVDKDGGKEDESKSAIKWTEYNQMNLRDLRNLKLERNQCLENHITRRKESTFLSAEKNLIGLDTSGNLFNVTQISTTRHNPFDPSHDFYDGMPIPGSAPSNYIPRRNPFDPQYEPNEENPELKRDHVEQESVSSVPNNTIFSRHESLRPSRLGDARQVRQDLQWRPVFVPEQLTSEGTSYCTFRRPPSESKLSSIPDTESLSSGEDLDEQKFNEHVKEAEVISNIYQASDLVDHIMHSSEDLYHLEIERPEKKDVQHGELEIKLGQVEKGNASLSGTGEFVIHVEPITNAAHLKPEAFEDKNSNRSSLSSSSEADEKSSDLRKDGSNTFEPFKTEQKTRSGMVDDKQHEEPVYDTSPPGSAKVLSFDSIPSDIQAEISEVVPLSSSAEKHAPSVDQALYSDFHGKIEKSTSGNEQIGATSHEQASVENGRGSGECNQIFLPSSHSDVHEDLPKNLNVKAAFPDSSPRYDSPIYKTPSAERKNFFSSDMPSFDDHNASPESPLTILSKPKEDSSIKDVNAVGVQDTHVSPKPFSEANLGEQTTKGNSSKVETSTKGSTKEIASSNTETGVKEPVATPNFLKKVSQAAVPVTPPNSPKNFSKTGVKQLVSTNSPKKVSENNDTELSTPSNFKDGSTELGTKTSSPKEVPKTNDRQNSDGSTELGTSAAGSTKDITSTNIGIAVQETVTTRNALKEVSEDNVGELPKLSNPKDGSTDVGNNTVGSTKDIALSRTGSGVKEAAETPVKQVSESDVSKQPKSSKDITLSNTGSGVQETATTPVKEVSKNDVSESAKSARNDVAKVATNDAVDSTTSIQETVTSLPKHIPQGDLSELPKSSNSKDGSNKVESYAVGSAKETASNTQGTGVQETVSTQTPVKELSEIIVGDQPKASASKDEHKEMETNSKGNTTELPKSSDLKDGSTTVPNTVSSTKSDQETISAKQASEGNNGEIPKPSKDGSTEVGTNVGDSTKKLAPSNIGASVQESISTQTETKVAEGELPKPSSLKDESPKAGVNAVGSTKDTPSSNTESGVQKSISTAQGDVAELPRPSNSEGHVGEVSKPSISEESNAGELPKPKIPKESDAVESQKPTDPAESNAGESQNPPESKGWLWW